MIEPTAPSAPPRALKPQPRKCPARRRALRLRPVVGWSFARLGLDGGMLLAAALASSLGSQAAGRRRARRLARALRRPGRRSLRRPRHVPAAPPRRHPGRSPRRRDLDVARGHGRVTLRALTTDPVTSRLRASDRGRSRRSTSPPAGSRSTGPRSRRAGMARSPADAHRRRRPHRPPDRQAPASQPELGLKPIGFLDKDPMAAATARSGSRCSAPAGTSSASSPTTTSSR